MSQSRLEMDRALKYIVVVNLRTRGFKGSFPRFRRFCEDAIDLITFQFDRSGGGFVIEIARCPLDGIVTDWDEVIPGSKVRAWDVTNRVRIGPPDASDTDYWFRYDTYPISQIIRCKDELLKNEDLWRALAPLGGTGSAAPI